MLRRLKINKFRKVAPGTVLEFGDGINLVLGINGAGKTTLLELIAAVCSRSLAKFADEPIDIEATFLKTEDGVEICQIDVIASRLPSSLAHRHADKGLRRWEEQLLLNLRAPHLPSQHFSWAESVLIQQKPEDAARSAYPTDFMHDWMSPLSRKFMEEELDTETDVKHLYFTMENLFDARGLVRMDEALRLFNAIHGDLLSGYPPGSLYVILNGDGTLYDIFGESVPANFSELNDSEVRDVMTDPTSCISNICARIAAVIGCDAVKFEWKETAREIMEGRMVHRFGQFRFALWRHDGSVEYSDRLSFGQQRILTFLWMIACARPKAPIVVDEISNGLHREWLRTALDEIQGRQAFLSSQNPLLMDFLEFASEEQVRRSFVRCDLEMRDGREVMVWRNFSDEEVGEFYAAYQAGFQQVSEILEARKLW